MFKLLVNTPAGTQEVIEVTASGSYFDRDRVLWDERQDGLIDPYPLTLGGMVRVNDDEGGSSLAFSQDLYDSRPVPVQVITVTMAQARKALILSGVSMMDVEAALASIPDDTARALAQADWEYSTTVRSNSPLVQSIGAQLDLDIDSLFSLAVTL